MVSLPCNQAAVKVSMLSPGIVFEPYATRESMPFWKRWFTRTGWRRIKEEITSELKSAYAIAKLRKTGYSKQKFYEEALDLYKEALKNEIRQRESVWRHVYWELVEPVVKIRTLRARMIGVDRDDLSKLFIQLTLEIVTKQKFEAYNSNGAVIAGDKNKEVIVRDIWVFEKSLFHKGACWRLCVRHGESQGNKDDAAYTVIPDHKIPLTSQGFDQAELAGTRIRDVISDQGASHTWKVYFYVSPYERTRTTLREIGRAFPRKRVIGVREECRIREQDFGNFQVAERMKVIKETREKFGRFFFRFPEGESAADVFDRVSSFLESLWRDIDMNRLHSDPGDDLNLIIVSHGLAIRVFLMKWFKWTVEQFERLNNLENCEFRIMQLGSGGDYSLAVHHSEEEMQAWGLCTDMIADQKWRACATRGDWNEKCPWYLDAFFDTFADSSDDEELETATARSQQGYFLMAHPSDQRLCSQGAVRCVVIFVGLFLVLYIVRPSILWSSNLRSSVLDSCPLCSCDCDEDSTLPLPLDVLNSSFADCAKDNPEMNEEMKKDIITLLSEEINLLKNVTSDSLEHTNALITGAKRASSHYQREAEKCNTGMETCEEARERAQAALIEERKLSELWESRARDFGWNDE
nr:phosphoglycerate mutase-like protein AT74H [Ipomoea batatas]